MRNIKSIINGQTVGSSLPKIDKYHPATGELIAQVEPATEDMVDQAVKVAAVAQKAWAATDPQIRGRIMQKAAELMRDKIDEIAKLEVQDVGKPYREAVDDAMTGPDAFEFFGSIAQTETGDVMRYPSLNVIAYTDRVPLGVCAGIGAWNFPTQILCWKTAPALAAGNAFIFKPSELTPIVGNRLAEIFKEAGVPDGVFQIVHGDFKVGKAMCSHPDIAKISLTGGVETGKIIMSQCAPTLKKVTLELGGKSPLIIFDDADFDAAVETACAANFYTAGEVCSNATRVFVQEGIYDKLVAALVEKAKAYVLGDPLNDSTTMGALISKPHTKKVLDYIAVGQSEGATLAVGGKQVKPAGCENGNFVEPTIFTNCSDNMKIVQEEIFGPVMAVLKFSTEEEAIARANATKFGLGAGLMTADLSRGHRVAAALESGNVWVNNYNFVPPGMPFGGSKHSGFGRENCKYSLEAYSEIKTTFVQL